MRLRRGTSQSRSAGDRARKDGLERRGEGGFLTKGSEWLGKRNPLPELAEVRGRQRYNATWDLIYFSVVEGGLPEAFRSQHCILGNAGAIGIKGM